MSISTIKASIQDATVRKGPPCGACDFLGTLSLDEADGLVALLADPAVRYTALADALLADPDYDVDLSSNTLARHARGLCAARTKLRG